MGNLFENRRRKKVDDGGRRMTTPFDFNPEEDHEIICPSCNKVGTLVSVERVFQTYPVYYTKDGELEFIGQVQKEVFCDEHGIECTCCGAEFSRDEIRETEQALQLQEKEEEE